MGLEGGGYGYFEQQEVLKENPFLFAVDMIREGNKKELLQRLSVAPDQISARWMVATLIFLGHLTREEAWAYKFFEFEEQVEEMKKNDLSGIFSQIAEVAAELSLQDIEELQRDVANFLDELKKKKLNDFGN